MKRIIYLFTILLFVASCGKQRSQVQHFNFGGGYDHIATVETETVKEKVELAEESTELEKVEENAQSLNTFTEGLTESSSKKDVKRHLRSLKKENKAKENKAKKAAVKLPVKKLKSLIKDQKNQVENSEDAQASDSETIQVLLIIILILLLLGILGIDLLTLLIIALILILLGVIVV